MGRQQRARVRRTEPVGPRPRDVLEPAAGVLAAFAVMTAAAAVSLNLLGAGRIGSVRQMVPALVALSAGGSLNLGLGSDLALPIASVVNGGLQVTPLGLTVLGAAVIAMAFLVPLRRRPPLNASALALRAGTLLVGYPLLAGIAAGMGHGAVALNLGSGSSGGSGNSGGTGSGSTPNNGLSRLRDLGGLLGNLRNRNGGGSGAQPGGRRLDLGQLLGDHFTITYRTDVPTTVFTAFILITALLTVCWLGSRRTPLPEGWTFVAAVRPVVSAAIAVALGLLALGALIGVAIGVVSHHAGWGIAGVLLCLPNLIAAGLSLALGVSWSLDTSGLLGTKLASALHRKLPNDGAISLYSGPHHSGGVAPALVLILILLVFGVLAAARLHRPGRSVGSPLRRGALLALAVGGFTAVALAIVTKLAGISAELNISAFGFSLPALTAAFAGGTGEALLRGLLGGAAAALVGTLLVHLYRWLRSRRALTAREAVAAVSPAPARPVSSRRGGG